MKEWCKFIQFTVIYICFTLVSLHSVHALRNRRSQQPGSSIRITVHFSKHHSMKTCGGFEV